MAWLHYSWMAQMPNASVDPRHAWMAQMPPGMARHYPWNASGRLAAA